MEQEKLYCPPSGTIPQPLPDYCKFENGIVRTDLKYISDSELKLWGWEGPYYHPTPKIIMSDVGLDDEQRKELLNGLEFEFNLENNIWTSVNYDFDPETHKCVWYSKERRFIFIPKDEDEFEYEIPYKSSAVFGIREDSSQVEIEQNIVTKHKNDIATELNPSWSEFKTYLITSKEINEFVVGLMGVMPIVAMSFPSSISKLDLGIYDEFILILNLVKINNLISPELLNSIRLEAIKSNLPPSLINILSQ